MALRAGRLKHRLILQKPSRSVDATSGEHLATWGTLKTVWGAVEPMRGSELTNAQQRNGKLTHKVTIRHTNGVASDNRILAPKESTTIAAAIATTSVTAVTLASALPFPGRDDNARTIRIRIESEVMEMTAGFGTVNATVSRGVDGTTPATHADATTVHHMAVLEIGELLNMNESDHRLELLCSEKV